MDRSDIFFDSNRSEFFKEKIAMKCDLEYIRRAYNVPVKKGTRILYKDRKGIIIGARGPYLLIRLDGDKQAMLYHPTWEIEYLGENNG